MSPTLEEMASLSKLARLHQAFKRKVDLRLIEKILQSPGDINCQVANDDAYAGCTALHLSERCRDLQFKVVQLLLRYEADFTIKNSRGVTVLHQVLETLRLASTPYDAFWGLSEKVSIDIVHAILSAHIDKSISKNPENKHGFTHFHMACMADHAPAALFFLDNGVSIDLAVGERAEFFQGSTPLFIAAKSCAFEVVHVLLRYGANPNAKDEDGLSLVHWLIECNIRILDSLIIEQVQVKREIWLSKFKTNQRIIGLLLHSNLINSSVPIDEIGLSNLHIACTLENLQLVENLLDRETLIDSTVNVNSNLWPGYTAMHFAAYFNLDTVKLLLSKGAGLMIESRDGLTPFDVCLDRYAVEDIHFIMSTQPNWKDITLIDGRTKLLGLVLAMQDIAQFREFLDQHVDDINTSVSKNSPVWPGYTVLHVAVRLSEQPKNLSQYVLHPESHSNEIEGTVKFTPNLQMIEECLIRGAEVTAADAFGCTPLHLAFHNRQSLTIGRLLQFHHITVNPVDKHNVSHLHIACASQDTNVVERLLQSGANIELQTLTDSKFLRRRANSTWLQVEPIPAGSTCLHIAVAGRNIEIVRLLLDNGADVNATDDYGATPIHCLFVQGSSLTEGQISHALLSSDNLREVIAGDSGITHLHVASYNYEDDAVRRLLDLGANIDARLGSQTALDKFNDRYNNGEIPPLNYECFAEITALNLTLMRGAMNTPNILITHGADFLTRAPCQESPLDIILDNDDANDCLEFLARLLTENEALAKRVEEEWGLTLLHLACCTRKLDLVKKLIEGGVDVNARLNEQAMRFAGYTSLHFVIKMSETYIYGEQNCLTSNEPYIIHFLYDIFETIRLLLAANADVTLCDSKGNSPLHMQINTSPRQLPFESKLLNLMLNTTKDFRVNPVGKAGWSHFHIACYQNNTTVIEKFLKHRVDVNVPVDFFHFREAGSSALHLVVRKPYENMAPLKMEIIDVLLRYGADVNAQNAEGDTVLHRVARFASHRVDIIERLFRARADLSKVNIACETPFATLLLSKKATPEVVELFIQNGCLINDFNAVHQRGCLTLPLCISDSVLRANILQVLFKSPDIMKTDATGRTAIHNIVSADGFDISDDVSVEEYSWLIRRLCQDGCDIDSEDQSGRTALHYASQFKNVQAISALLINGADVNVIDNFGNTAFRYSFDTCECGKVEKEHIHAQAIKIFYIHVRKLKYLKLSVNEINRNMMLKANNCPMDFNPNEMERFYREANDIKSFTFEEESNSISLNALLSETRIVAMYPHKVLLRALVDKFYQNMDVYFRDYSEVIGLIELQCRKAVKRVTLIDPAAQSFSELVGFAFPQTCCSVLFKFLSNLDLENLTLAANDL